MEKIILGLGILGIWTFLVGVILNQMWLDIISIGIIMTSVLLALGW